MAGDGGGGLVGWWNRARAKTAASVQEARELWFQRGRRQSGAVTSEDLTQPLPVVGPEDSADGSPRMHGRVSGGGVAATRWFAALGQPRAAANPLAAAWADPSRRLWLVTGAASVLVVLVLIFGGQSFSRRLGVLPGGRVAQPASEQVTPVPSQAAPPAQGQPPAAQPPPAEQPAARALGLAALPLLLGLFWLLSAWLVDAEARRAFVVQEPWGERRTVAYSCLAVGCVFPLILAGLLFAAYGFVSFVVFVANRQSWVAGIQAGALILIACASFLLLRSAIASYLAGRRSHA